MAEKKGTLSINSDNIFPIIKKWLYSDHDIFVREMVSNGCDAITKLKKLDMMGEYQLPDGYKPKITVEVERQTQVLINYLSKQNIHVLEINLYDIANEILKKRDILNKIFAMEQDISKEQLKELLQNVLDSEAHLIPEISRVLDKNLFDILFITGIGEVFPYIRSHNVLNNLQSTAKDKPTVMFFPGEYTHSLVSGASLDLFGVLHDDKYYRAFNIFHCEF